jgi:hypothetical protein
MFFLVVEEEEFHPRMHLRWVEAVLVMGPLELP